MYKNLFWLAVGVFVVLPVFSELILRVVYLYTATDVAYSFLAAPLDALREAITVTANYVSIAVLCITVTYFGRHAKGVIVLAFVSNVIDTVTYMLAYYLYTDRIVNVILMLFIEMVVNCLATLVIWLAVSAYAKKRHSFLNVGEYKLGTEILGHPYTRSFAIAVGVFGAVQLGFVLYDMIDSFLDPSLGTPINMKETVYWVLQYAEVILLTAIGFVIAVVIGLFANRIRSSGKERARMINEARGITKG